MSYLEDFQGWFITDRKVICPKCGYDKEFYYHDFVYNRTEGYAYVLWCRNCHWDEIYIPDNELALQKIENPRGSSGSANE